LFPTQHTVKENSTDVGVFVSYANHSSGILVIDGRTGELSWLFHSMAGLPVAPIPVPGDLSTQQAFVMWLPKLEALTLIVKPRKSRQIQQQGSDGNDRRDYMEINLFGFWLVFALFSVYKKDRFEVPFPS